MCVCGTTSVTVVSAEVVGEFVAEVEVDESMVVGTAADEATVIPRTDSAVFTLTQPISTPYWFGSGIAKQLVPKADEQAAI